uniref:Uncharacterized protein n=1 Tax=Arundo donax TaxID=35708 RepID=A0A0A8YUM3_ARUDO
MHHVCCILNLTFGIAIEENIKNHRHISVFICPCSPTMTTSHEFMTKLTCWTSDF